MMTQANIAEKLTDCELLEPLQVIEFDPGARYLVVARSKYRLSAEAAGRLHALLNRQLKQFLGEIKFSLAVLDDDMELNFYQFKERGPDE